MKYVVRNYTVKVGWKHADFYGTFELLRIGIISFRFAHHFLEFPDLIHDSQWTPNFLIFGIGNSDLPWYE